MNAPSHSRRRKRPVLAPDEYRRRRRERRLERTSHSEAQVRSWAERSGLALRVLNGGQHWQFQKSGFVAEWWPSSARLVLNRDYLRDYHAPHWPDVMAVLQQSLVAQAVGRPAASESEVNHERKKTG